MAKASILALAGLAACLMLTSCSSTNKVDADVLPAPAPVPVVAVAKAAVANLSRSLVLTAEFEPFQRVDVMAKVAGYVKQINVDVGDRVRAGQVLAILEVPEMADDLARAKAAVERSEADVTRAKDEVRRAESAHELSHLSYQRLAAVQKQRPGLVAQQEIDDAQSKDQVSEAQVAAAKSSLTVTLQQVDVNKAELSRVKTMLDYTRVTAPFTGVITKRFADTGSMIQAGTASQTQAMPLVQLSENSLLRLVVPVPESAVPTVRVGQPVDVQVPSLRRTFRGKVARFASKLEESTRTMDTEVDVPNPSLVLVPGMYAEVTLMLDRAAGVVSVPVSAVDVEEQEGWRKESEGRVLVITPSNLVEARNVSLGIESADRIEVRSGLRDGDLVVVGNRTGLEAGQKVKPKLMEDREAK